MKFLTLEDLCKFCKKSNFQHFSSKEFGGKSLVVQSIETFEVSDISKDGLMPVKLKSCHIGENRNQSSISEEKMNLRKNTFKGRPILGAIYKTDTGEYEFRGHDMNINEDGDIEYIEQPIGVISEIEEPYLEYDKEEDKTYLMVSGNIFEDYSHASEILKRRRTCKCSVEIEISEFSWDVETDCLSIDDFSFRAVTILGYEQDGITEIQEGMKGSKITIDDFSSKSNSVFATETKLIETLDKLNDTLSSFNNTNFNTKGVESKMNHFEELLESYGVTLEEVDFEYEGLTDEELDAAFEEHFGCKKKKCESDELEDGESEEDEFGCKKKKCEADDDPESSDTPSSSEDEDVESADDDKSKKKYSISEDGMMTINYQISHDDIRNGIYNLLFAEEGVEYPWIISVYNDHFIYCDDKCYKRSYAVDGENVSIGESKAEVFCEWLTAEERDAMNALKSDYEALKEFKENCMQAEAHANKEEILNSNEYDSIRETDEFKELIDKMDEFSVNDISVKADLIFAAMAKKQFAATSSKENKSLGMNFNVKPSKKNSAYGNLFDE